MFKLAAAFPVRSTTPRWVANQSSSSLSHVSFAPKITQPPGFFHPPSNFRGFSAVSSNDGFRNVAIIAHVDHGKTTLVDGLLRTSGTTDGSTDRLMDCNDIEKERGITIMSKNTSIDWKGRQINIVDTPGHGDFGGEVERIMSMVDGALLVVDASEGVMVQTKFVLGKALKAGLKIMLILNKMDRSSARPEEVESEVFDLMAALGATDAQLDYRTYYCSAYNGWVRTSPIKGNSDTTHNLSMGVILDSIVEHLPAPPVSQNLGFSMLVSLIDSEPIFGRILTGKVHSGTVKAGQTLTAVDPSGNKIETGKITKLFGKRGLKRIEIEEGGAGDIISLAGFSDATVATTLFDPATPVPPIPSIPIDPPVLSMMFGVNDSPLAGKEGKIFTAAQIKRRLEKEVEGNISFILEPGPTSETMIVKGRGELQLGVLIENMRREGFELTIGPPQVLTKIENGQKMEPSEEVVLDVPNECVSKLMEAMSMRKATLQEMKQIADKTRLTFECPSRSLLGFRSDFITYTRGAGIMNSIFKHYVPYKGDLVPTRKGVLVSTSAGRTTGHALSSLEARGVLFCAPGVEVYPGMLVGEYSRDLSDLPVNPVKAKQLTNVRAAGKDEAIRLSPPRPTTIESAISYIQVDEVLEVTPKTIRMRKRDLNQDFQKIQKK